MNMRNFSLPQLAPSQQVAKSVQQQKYLKKPISDNSFDNEEYYQKDRQRMEQKNRRFQQLEDQGHYQKQKRSPTEISYDDEYYQILKAQQKMLDQMKHPNIKSQSILKNKNMLQIMPYDNFLKEKKVQLPQLKKLPRDKRVLLEIEKINQKRQEKEYQRYLEQQLKDYKDTKLKSKLKQELERRKLELGIAPTKNKKSLHPSTRSHSRKRWRTQDSNEDFSDDNSDDIQRQFDQKLDVVILDEGERIPSAKLKLRKFIPPMQLLDIQQEEEDRDRIIVQMWLNKYQKLFKTLFNKYCNTVRSNVEDNFSHKDQKSKSLNLGEIFKFCKDHNILQELLTKEEIQSLVRLISLKNKKTEELGNLDMEQFSKFYLQMAHNIYYCKQNKVRMPLIEQLNALLNHMQKAILYKGENISLYEDPDFVVGMDKQKLKYLNNQIGQDPSMEIPEGFYKVYEKELIMDYSMPEYLPIKESKKVVIETLDSLVNDIFGIHILEARAFPTMVPKIKQAQNIFTGKHKKNLNEIIQQKQETQRTQMQFTQELPSKKPISSNMSDNIGKLLEQNPDKYKSESLEQVALTLENMLSKLSINDKSNIEVNQTKQQIQIINKLQQDKLKRQQEDYQKEREREEKRLKHEKEVKERLKLQQQEKEGKEYDKKKSVKEQELSEAEKRKIQQEKRQKEFDLKKKALDEKKIKDMEELQRQKQEEQEKLRIESELKQKLKKEFLKNQKEKIKKDFENKINDRKDLEVAQKKFIDQSTNKMNTIKSNMVDYIKSTKDDRKKEEEQQREDSIAFYNSEETQNLLQKYDKGLKQYYKFYAAQEKQQIDFNLEAKNETISQTEFVKFGYQSNIYPALITNQELLYVFKQVVREKLATTNNSQISQKPSSIYEKEVLYVIDYEYFKKALIRIAAIAQDKLSGQQTVTERVQSRSQPKRNIETPESSLQTQSKFNLGGSLTRKTIQQKEIKELQGKAPKYDTKIEDKIISKQINISNMTAHILEKLFLFLNIGQGDSSTKVYSKIHDSRVEISGQRPTKFKKEDAKKFKDN